jgi:hypothetical protein
MANRISIAGLLFRRGGVPLYVFRRLAYVTHPLMFLLSTVAPCSNAQERVLPEPVKMQSPCQVTVSAELALDCSYSARESPQPGTSHFRLVHSSLLFSVKSESYMQISLTITNDDAPQLEEKRPVFLVIDDAKGMNYLRRSLPHVDLAALKPGETGIFSERLLVGAFNSGDYIISLWIPSSDPGRTYEVDRNLLLGGESVANPTTRLNQLAQFTVKRSFKRKTKSN